MPFGKYWHRYAYGGDDPTNNLDPKGLLSGRELVGSCLVGGGLGGAAGAIGGAFVGVSERHQALLASCSSAVLPVASLISRHNMASVRPVN